MWLNGTSFAGFFQGGIRIQAGLESPHADNIVIVFGKNDEHHLVIDRQPIKAETIDGRCK